MSKFQNLSKEELLKLANKQEKELASKKYGLVWDSEREPEQVVLDCANNLPVLKRVKGKVIKTDNSEDNILIEGDNYHALTVLNYTHKEKIDVIYIDPPYNTGNKDFIYNDRYVDKEDGYRHSKWLNFMEKRLNLAKDLLKKTGVIFISIDDNEIAQLKLLCDKIFGEENFIGNIIWEKKYSPANDSKKISDTHDFVLVYKNTNWILNLLGRTQEMDKRYRNQDNDPRGVWKAGGFSVKSYSKSYDYPIKTPSGKIVNPPFGSCWQTSKKNYEKLKKDNRIWFGKNNDSKPQIKQFLSEVQQGLVPKSIWFKEESGHNQLAMALLKEIIGEKAQKFGTTKPLKLLNRIIKIASSKKDAIILDFFAGSGTTGHAVLALNNEDGGNRKFILCSNNENNNGYGKIMDDVCYPRIEKVIKGYKKNGNGEKVKGLGGNLQYLKTFLIKKTKNQDQVKVNLTQKCTEMLCVKENIFNLEKGGQDYKIFFSNKKDKFLCVYYNFLDDSFDEFLKEIKKLKGKKIIYMFSVDNKVDKSLFASVDNFTIEAIPQKILDVYKQLVKMNIPVKTDIIFLELNKAKIEIFNEKEKDAGARRLRIVLEKLIQKVAQNNGINILSSKGKEEKISALNDKLKHDKIFMHIEWEENRTYLTIGNYASHGDNDEYNMEQVENFYKHIRSLLNNFNI